MLRFGNNKLLYLPLHKRKFSLSDAILNFSKRPIPFCLKKILTPSYSHRGLGYLYLVNVECYAGSGLCDGPIPCPEEP
jgi:hypothetical protein